jgi:hypothetical protein
MGWVLMGAVIAALAIVAGWVSRKFQGRDDRSPGGDILLEVTATRQVGGWIGILVTVSNRAPSELYVQTIKLIDPALGELVIMPDVESPFVVSEREVNVTQAVPPHTTTGTEDSCINIKLALDDPRALIDTISLTVVVSRQPDRSDLIDLDCHTRVWVSPLSIRG